MFRQGGLRALRRAARCLHRVVRWPHGVRRCRTRDDEQWGDVLLVEHPDTQAFLDMLVAERYRACAYHREAAIEDSRLVLITAGELNYLT
ncbi:MAG: hypothetical protein ACU85U_06315 [Gammaproteobacteria bacterium]